MLRNRNGVVVRLTNQTPPVWGRSTGPMFWEVDLRLVSRDSFLQGDAVEVTKVGLPHDANVVG